MTIKKQYWIDFSLFSPNIKAELITIPDLEIPGRIAIDWNIPNSKADLKLKLNENEFFNYNFVQYSLLANGALIILMSLLKNSFSFNFNLKSALLLGVFQSIAILPGISRSGMLISSLVLLELR